MPKIDPYTNAIGAEATETRSFTDPAQPGKALDLTMIVPDDPLISIAIEERGADNADAYVGHPELVPPVGGRRIRVTRQLCRAVAILQTLESPPGGERPYDLPQWAALFLTMPVAMAGVMDWVTGLIRRADADPKKG